jgi:hypothetical protein
MTGEDMMEPQILYLICDTCGYCCSLHGPVARAIAAEPPECPSCHHPTRTCDHAPSAKRAS